VVVLSTAINKRLWAAEVAFAQEVQQSEFSFRFRYTFHFVYFQNDFPFGGF
jgi:hypothetical protein